MFVPEPDYILYGFPSIDGPKGGVKVAIHGSDEICSASSIDREIRQEDLNRIRSRVAIRVPSLNGALVKARPCMYTMTPDENPIICQHPHFPSVSIAAGFSGHGFKMASVIGEVLADLAVQGQYEVRNRSFLFATLCCITRSQ
jgi:sarcosine oxidase